MSAVSIEMFVGKQLDSHPAIGGPAIGAGILIDRGIQTLANRLVF